MAFVLIGCSADNEPNQDPKPVAPSPQRPAPVEDANVEDTTTCTIVKSVWAGNCVVEVIECSDSSEKLDSRCYPPDYAFPWKNAPDPPY